MSDTAIIVWIFILSQIIAFFFFCCSRASRSRADHRRVVA